MLRYGLAYAEYAAIVISSYQTVLSFLDVQTYCVGVGNMENKPRQYQLKVSSVRPQVAASLGQWGSYLALTTVTDIFVHLS